MMMQTLRTIFVAGLLACMLAGCASTGVGTLTPVADNALALHIQAGSTTREQLRLALGSAAVVSFDSGYEVWVYKNQEGAPKLLRYVPVVGLGAALVPTRTRELVVRFGPDGVVRKVRVHRS